MMIKYTRMEEEEHFKDALKQDVFLALRILPNINVLLRDMLASLEKKEISPSVAAKLNELTLVELEKILNILMMLGSNLAHFEDEKKELLTEQPQPEVEQTKQKIETLMQTIQSMSSQNKLED